MARPNDEISDADLRGLENLIAGYSAEALKCFLPADDAKRGLVHSTALTSISVSGTASALALFHAPRRLLQLDDDVVQRWTDVVKQRSDQALQVLVGNTARPLNPKAIAAAFHVAEGVRANAIAGGEEVLLNWAQRFCSDWLGRNGIRNAPMRLLWALVEHVRGHADCMRALRAVAEHVFWEEVARHAAGLRGFDAVQLGLAVALVDDDVSLADRFRALELLRDCRNSSGVWDAQPTPERSGMQPASSFHAVAALVEAIKVNVPGAELLVQILRSHARWLADSRTKATPWAAADVANRRHEPESWFACLALDFTAKAEAWMQDRAQQATLSEYRGYKPTGGVPWAEIILAPADKAALSAKVVEPARGLPAGKKLPTATAILFGPPGTAKTSIAEAIAAEVGWPLIEIGVSHFLIDGLDSVFSRAQRVFDDLLRLSRVVVLLDEVEGVFARRDEGAGSELVQQFLTSSLLPPLKRLHDRAQAIVFIATNHVEKFDDAAKRLGRVDMVIPVGPPGTDDRTALLRKFGIPEPHVTAFAAVLGERTTIGELLLVRQFTDADRTDMHALSAAWERVSGQRRQISEPQMEKFRADESTFRRV